MVNIFLVLVNLEDLFLNTMNVYIKSHDAKKSANPQ